jgi:hypothetical protein
VFQAHDHQNRPGRDASGEQVQEAPNTYGGLASAGQTSWKIFSSLSIK